MNCAHPMSAATLTATAALPSPMRPGAAARQLLAQLLDTLGAWHHNWRSRRDLLALDDHLLKDIGLTRSQVHAEAHKPFWQL